MQDEYIFEWDAAKSALNAKKHGISFEQACAIWDDPLFLEVYLVSEPEDRWAVIGRFGKSSFLTAIITYRANRVRIISARMATKKEVEVYYGKN